LSLYSNGINLYQEGSWRQASDELRRALDAASDKNQWAEALYWVILSEMAGTNYERALQDINSLTREAPHSDRSGDVLYHKARIFYYQGLYEDSLLVFRQYYDSSASLTDARKVLAIYWMGECLYSLGQYDRAAEFFGRIIESYPNSSRYEASVYKMELIRQKRVETELLALLRWSHEESMRTAEEYQRMERTYEQALNAYQKRLSELLDDTRISELESSNAEYMRRLTEAYDLIRTLQAQLPEQNLPGEELIQRASRLRNQIQWDLDIMESLLREIY
jgi:TolA-binding protein